MTASESVRVEWLRRVEAEYRSAALTQHFGLWLIQLAAPPDLITQALDIVADEIAHAELSHETYRAAGGTQPPAIVRESLSLRPSRGPLEHDILRHGVQIFCLGETVAVRLFERMRRDCTEPSARAALDRILRDEVRHRDFGWTLLEWLLATPSGPALCELIQGHLGDMLSAVRRSYGGDVRRAPADAGGGSERASPGADVPVPVGSTAFAEADRAWGLIPTTEYVAAFEETWQRDYRPRFSALGIDIGALGAAR